MIEENFSLSDVEIKLLKNLIGKKILCIESLIFPGDDDFWWPVRIDTDSSKVIVCNDLTVAKYFETEEDCGRLSIKEGGGVEFQEEENKKIYNKKINRIVEDVIVVEDKIIFPEDKEYSSYKFIYPIAIIIKFNDDSLVIERGWIFQEYMNIQLQDNNMINVREELSDWYDPDEDNTVPEIIRNTISLSNL